MSRRHGERGFTLVELMIALVVSTIIVGFLIAIHSRLSIVYRSQTGIAHTVETLRSARQFLQQDLRMAGFMIPNGTVNVSSALSSSGRLPAVAISNNVDGDGPDSFRVLYAKIDTTTPVTEMSLVASVVTVDDPTRLNADLPVLLVAGTASCVVKIESTLVDAVDVTPGGSVWNEAPTNLHCAAVAAQVALGVSATASSLIVRGYRIDPTRPAAGVLQRSNSGAFEVGVDDWEDLGVGFTNLQIASRFHEAGDVIDLDGDGDPQMDWYSSENQEPVDATGSRPATAVISAIALSIEVHGNGGKAEASPAFVVTGRRENNRLGDWGDACPSNPTTDPCGVDLANLEDVERPVRYQGDHIYRWSTSFVDLRNIGIGL